jgi:hypothetical protein
VAGHESDPGASSAPPGTGAPASSPMAGPDTCRPATLARQPVARVLPFPPRGNPPTPSDRPRSSAPCRDEAKAVLARAEAACARYRQLAAEQGLSPATLRRRKNLCRRMESALALLRARRRAAELERSNKAG